MPLTEAQIWSLSLGIVLYVGCPQLLWDGFKRETKFHYIIHWLWWIESRLTIKGGGKWLWIEITDCYVSISRSGCESQRSAIFLQNHIECLSLPNHYNSKQRRVREIGHGITSKLSRIFWNRAGLMTKTTIRWKITKTLIQCIVPVHQ